MTHLYHGHNAPSKYVVYMPSVMYMAFTERMPYSDIPVAFRYENRHLRAGYQQIERY